MDILETRFTECNELRKVLKQSSHYIKVFNLSTGYFTALNGNGKINCFWANVDYYQTTETVEGLKVYSNNLNRSKQKTNSSRRKGIIMKFAFTFFLV